MVIEIRSFSFLVKKIVINSRFGRFLHGFQKTFLIRKEDAKCELQIRTTECFCNFFCCAKLCELFLSIFNDLKIFLQILLASMKTILFLLESIFCAFSNEILHSLLL